jgi:hypothetical protein
MSENFGPGVSRTLSAYARQYQTVVWQKGKPPLDSELNLMSQIDLENAAQEIRSQVHSGFFVDPTHAKADFFTDADRSNFFNLGRQATGEEAPIVWANVNGWIIPVTGTAVADGDTSNAITLYPPPASDTRIDLVFLEAWATLIAPNPSTANKPTASTVWKYGNTEFGGTNIQDDLIDGTIGFETTERVQVQYRLRVFGQGSGLGASVNLDVYPDGLDDPNITGQGTATSPVAGFTWENMRETSGDAGLWRAGNGDPENDLGTVDGYTYAIPVAAIFRRNTTGFEAYASGGNANQNGGFNRNPSAAYLSDPRDGAKTFGTLSLTNAISDTAVGVIALTGLTNSPLVDPYLSLGSTYLTIGDEIVGPITAVTSTTITLAASTRGRGGTQASSHPAGAAITLYNPRPDGLWADQIAETDILDLRKGVTFGDWDYNRILVHNLTRLVQGDLRTTFKQSSSGETQGLSVVEVSYMTSGLVPNSVTAVDRFDGVRTVWSDAASLQPDTTVMCDCNFGAGFNNLDTGVNWDIGAGFRPQGFFTSGGTGVNNGSSVFLYIGGSTGNAGARATFVDPTDNRYVRFVSPAEYWKSSIANAAVGRQTPVTVRWIDQPDLSPLAVDESGTRPGPMYPTPDTNFETPFIVLGGVLNGASTVIGTVTVYNNSPSAGEFEVDLPGLTFDAAGSWWNGVSINDTSTSGITNTVLRGQRNLYDMLTRGGRDLTGRSSEVYLVLFGDTTNPENNGAFQVIGAGTVGYTTSNASATDRIRVRALTAGWTTFTSPGANLTAQLRSQYTNAEDDNGVSASAESAVAIVFTDIAGATGGSPWSGLLTTPQDGKMVINTTLQYHPGHAATPRVADSVWAFSTVNADTTYLRQATSALDGTFPVTAGVTPYDISHVVTWNRLPSVGLTAPFAPSYGGSVVAFSEQDRESEAFLDRGSKSLIFRPFRNRNMTLHTYSYTGTSTLVGDAVYAGPVPPALTPKLIPGTWDAASAYEVPPEVMPRFGRQDIPYNTGSGVVFLAGINHLFTDSSNTSAQVTNIVGGIDNGGVSGILPVYIQTGASSGLDYAQYGPIGGGGTGLDAYQGRLFSSDAVVSSDLGRGMKGIQLPPYIGTARVFGVYELTDFEANGPGASTNILDRGASKQTLFILQDGAQDITGETGDHTYIIPSNALDLTHIPTYVDGDTFADFNYVVAFSAFAFAKDWINGNNYVLARAHNGAGAAPTVPGELDSVNMIVPSPANTASAYIGYSRTPYQGDPYMTRNGGTRVTSDYQERYGQVPVADAFEVATPIQQFDANGNLVPQTPNGRALQVLAAFDFYTTLGTGKVGGKFYPGTPLDIGFIENTPEGATRLPSASNAPQWRTLTRAFSEGQRSTFSRASLGIEVLTNTSLAGDTITFEVPSENVSVTLTAGVEFAVGADITITTTNLTAAINANATLARFMTASSTGTTICTVTATNPGAAGNAITGAISDTTTLRIRVTQPTFGIANYTKANFSGGVDEPVNAGPGTSQLDMTGLTERLPLGILLSDSDFLCENPLNDSSSAFVTLPTGMQTDQNLLLLSGDAQEYTRFVGGPGQWLYMSDGSILVYEAYTGGPSTGTRTYRLNRGAATYVISEPVPGGPVDWVSGSLASGLKPVLKGGALVCKALLVRNFNEEAFTVPTTTTHGDEVQLVILTYGVFGDGATQQDGVQLSGIISPTGYGEGYAAADRYLCEGHPLTIGRVRVSPDPALPAVYPGRDTE